MPPLEGKPVLPSSELVRAELRAVCQSTVFAPAARLQGLLAYLVEESLAGSPLKESVVGVAVFGRDPGYDPKQDSVVRSEVRRLRGKLIEYYAGQGARDRILIDLPKGSYVLTFRFRQDEPAVLVEAPQPQHHANGWRGIIAASAAVVLAAVLLAGYGFRRIEARNVPAVNHRSAARRSVAVLDFRNLTARPEAGWLSSAIPEMISADLAAGRQLRTIPGENVSRMETELSLHLGGSASRQTLAAIRRNLGADIVVSGAYADLGAAAGNRVRVDIWAADAQSGDLIASVSESGTEPEILDLMSRAGNRLRSGLRLEAAAGEARMRAASPRDPTAARDYAGGLAHLRRGDLLQARDLLLACVQVEPQFGAAHATLSATYTKLGYESLARDEAKRAYELSQSNADAEQQLAIEAQYRETNHEYGLAVESYRGLFADHPDEIEYGLRLAAMQSAADEAQDALSTIEILRGLPAPESGDPRIDLEAAAAYARLSDYRRSADLAAAAARKAADSDARLLYARAVSYRSGLLWNLGDARWRELSAEALKICGQYQDQACVAAILRRLGNVSLVALDLVSANRYYREALQIAREIGSVAEEANVLNGMAMLEDGRGDLGKAAEIERRLIALGRETQNTGTQQSSLANLSDIMLASGEVDAAQENVEAALKVASAIGERESAADDLTSLAGIDRVKGDLQTARGLARQALANAEQTASIAAEMAAIEETARILMAQDDLPGAREAVRRAASLRNRGTDVSAWTDRAIAASLALAEHRLSEAATLAHDAAGAAASKRQPWFQARAEILLAEALLAQGLPEEARTAAQQALNRTQRSQFRLIRLEVAIAYARLTRAPEALPSLIAEAHRRHAYELELEAKLAAAELSRDRGLLVAVRTEALTRGFRYQARRAAEAGRPAQAAALLMPGVR